MCVDANHIAPRFTAPLGAFIPPNNSVYKTKQHVTEDKKCHSGGLVHNGLKFGFFFTS
jgi:hypothetical protein